MSVYRLEALRANGGPHLFPRVFDTIEEACAYAEASLDVMGRHAAWKMTGYRVKDTMTSRVITTVNWHDPDDPDDQDPFAAVLPGMAAGGMTGTGPGVVLSSAEASTSPVLPGYLEGDR